MSRLGVPHHTVEYRWGSPVRLDILRCMAAAILEDRERRNIESASDFFKRIMEPNLQGSGFCMSLDTEGKIKAPEITIDVSLRWRVEAIKADFFVTPTVEFRLEDYEAGPMPPLIKDRKARGLAPPSKAGGTWRWVPAEKEKDWSFVHISFP